MNIKEHGYRLFAGGGIMKESDMESEWRETVNKMGTMMNLIRKK
jgi:isochorismate synthase